VKCAHVGNEFAMVEKLAPGARYDHNFTILPIGSLSLTPLALIYADLEKKNIKLILRAGRSCGSKSSKTISYALVIMKGEQRLGAETR
jgi:hypothetical protein